MIVPIRGKRASPIGIAKYSCRKRSENSRPYLAGALFGVIFAFSIATRITGGTKMVKTRKIRLTAVCITATFAHFYDLPRGSRVSLSSTSMPVLISV